MFGTVPWSIEVMRSRFSKAIGNWYMTSFSITDVNEADSSVMAELIDLITMQDFHPDNGLNEINFSDF